MVSHYKDSRTEAEVKQDVQTIKDATELHERVMQEGRDHLRDRLSVAGLCSLFGGYAILQEAANYVKVELNKPVGLHPLTSLGD